MYAKVVSMLFYMFFTCVIFNPQVSGVTIYLYVLIPFLDPGFSAFLLATSRRWGVPVVIAVAVCLLSLPMAAAKVVSVAICIGYLMYTFSRRIEYLHVWMAINIVFALAQFVLYYVDYDLAVQLGPDQVSSMLWGDSATQTNTNFYEILYFARVSGFSREAGFFASLLVASFMIYLMERRPINRAMVVLYGIGLVISFSKASMVLLVFAILYGFRRQLRAIHPLVSLVLFTGASMAVALYMSQHNFFGSETFASRLSGYPFLFDARFSDILKGVTARQLNAEYGYLSYISMSQALYEINDVTFTSVPGMITDMGLVGGLLLLGVLAFTASDGFVILLFLLLTATVSLIMVTSFVPLAWLICYWPRFEAFRAATAQRAFVLNQRRAVVRSRRLSNARGRPAAT
ncbi:hypothetical protein [Paraburkholderia sp. GAS334]|jgi:hypothetical protein|uniref:hypothetical protein n=1 Tax=unclassified Paraburkholderia TaxID=2615204 RepID=UPI003D1B6A48